MSYFPQLQTPLYLNHAAIGPLAAPTVAAMHAAIAAQARGGAEAIGPWMAAAADARDEAAALLGVPREQVGFVPNTSTGLQAIAHGVRWRRGERIVLFRGEFPANVIPWQLAADRHGLEVVWLDVDRFRGPSGDGLAALDAALRGGVRLVAVSAVQFQSGLRMPIEAMGALCRAAGAELCVDAVQALGAQPLDLTDVDHLAAGGHKWLMAPMGTGLVWSRRWRDLRPELASWISVADAFDFLGEPGRLRYDRAPIHTPAMVEGGVLPFIAIAGLGKALVLANKAGPAATFAHVQPILDTVEQQLVAAGFRSLRSPMVEQRSCILAVAPPDGLTARQASERLAARGIATSTPDGLLRLSPSWPTTLPDDLDLAAALG